MNYDAFPYVASVISLFARCLFVFILYITKNANKLSLLFCILNLNASGIWFVYNSRNQNYIMISNNCIEFVIFSISSVYIIKNIWITRKTLPT